MRPGSIAFTVLWVVCLLAARAASAPQSSPQSQSATGRPQVPAFRARVTLVPIDVRVLDRDGKPITDLKQEDFTIEDEGVRQDIRHFSTQELVAEPPQRGTAPARPALRNAPESSFTPRKARVFLVVLGRLVDAMDGNVQTPSKGVDALIDFVRKNLLPQDVVGMMAYNRATDFTTEHEKVAVALERYRARYQLIEQRLQTFETGVGPLSTRDVPGYMQKDIDDLFEMSGLTSRRIVPLGHADIERIDHDMRESVVASMQAEIAASHPSSSLADQSVQREADRRSGFTPIDEQIGGASQTKQDLDLIYGGIESMRYLDGEKHLIFLTDQGIRMPHGTDDDRAISKVANDARVALDTVQAGGVYGGKPNPVGPVAVPVVPMSMQQSLKNIADFTGGQSSLNEYTATALDRIDKTTRFEYLLGYYPSDVKWDGRYRNMVVKVNRPGATVLYRHGYYASDELVPTDSTAFLAYRRVAVAANYAHELTDIQLSMNASRARGSEKDGGEVAIDGRIDVSRVSFTTVGDRHTATLDVNVYCGDSHETVIGQLWQKVNLKLTDATYRRYLREGMPYTGHVAIKGQAVWAKVIVYDYGADLVGSTAIGIR
jgi:VWFA-related protein